MVYTKEHRPDRTGSLYLSPSHPRVLGVDIGRVIIADDTDTPDRRIFGERYLDAPEVPGAIDTIRGLVEAGDWRAIHLVSKCGLVVQGRTREWLEHHEFFPRSGLNPKDLHFTLTRQEKGVVADELGITAFIDDRPDVLASLPERVATRILFGEEAADITGVAEGVIVAHTWKDVWSVLNQ